MLKEGQPLNKNVQEFEKIPKLQDNITRLKNHMNNESEIAKKNKETHEIDREIISKTKANHEPFRFMEQIGLGNYDFLKHHFMSQLEDSPSCVRDIKGLDKKFG